MMPKIPIKNWTWITTIAAILYELTQKASYRWYSAPYLAVHKEPAGFLLVKDSSDVRRMTFLVKGQELEGVLDRLKHDGTVTLDAQPKLAVRTTALLQ